MILLDTEAVASQVRIWKGYINQLAELLVGLEKGDQNAGVTIKKYIGELVRP